MAWQQQDYLKNQEAQYLPGLDSQKALKLAALKKAKDTAINDLNTQRDQMLPTYTDSQNAVDAKMAQTLQQMRDNMATNGLYRSGTMISDTAALQNQANTDIAKIGRDRTQFLTDIGNRINRANTDYSEGERLANDEYASLLRAEQNKALERWNAIDEQQRAATAAQAARVAAARASAARARSSSSRSSALTHEEKYDNMTGAMQSINDALRQGISHGNIQQSIQSQWDALSKQGIDPNALIKFLYNDSIAPLETTPEEL